MKEERSDLQWLLKLSVESFDDCHCLGPAFGAMGGELAHDTTDVAYQIVHFPLFHKLHCLWLWAKSMNYTT